MTGRRETDELFSVARIQLFPSPYCRELAEVIQQNACDSARQCRVFWRISRLTKNKAATNLLYGCKT
jgi:hypothetical protein